MLNQSFSVNNLVKLLKKTDPKRFRIGRNFDEYKKYISDKVGDSIESYTFSSLIKTRINSKNVYIFKEFMDVLVARKINDNVRRIYNIKQNNRHDIIKKVNTVLSEPVDYYIYRLDIKSFYESIDKDLMFKRIDNNPIVSHNTKKFIRGLFRNNSFSESNGLPRGMGLSATLSEIFMEDFDAEISRLPTVFYSSRYVDDIIIFSFSEIDNYEEYFSNLLPGNLTLNHRKCDEYNIGDVSKQSSEIEFLGYSFVIPHVVKNDVRKVTIKISKDKVNKIKRRIALAVKDYAKTLNSDLLRKRIKYLTGNIMVNTNKNKTDTLYSGIYYNYQYITDKTQLTELDVFKNRMLFASKGIIGKRIASAGYHVLSVSKKYSFHHGFEKKLISKFSLEDIIKINKVW
ncbi:hypothetical protein AU490_04800 [Lonsdalea populi]|uniref:RNA-directed DNA polymerase n=1 Tax=Lonsdalea populi TaxID=1172565 RepID=A0A3N0UNW3_9GAMM|nr:MULTISPECIES: antiviral reverse transcriptase Drt3a [Lonsdalea]RAT13902.1 hypothetical protein AU486_13750 [Lonsdalea quercina]RAT29983.1 hypothetical protein AU490_04800 [Lonsdalea populi]RAT36696.1 hypothetical protein AU491_06360 [Lonsdalea populi]RAT44944.1 hypothetical protein AU496_10320 [Lonsdalea populi]RAT48974.1 hypothetical protein AU497_15965 [Lonsdalea populi]